MRYNEKEKVEVKKEFLRMLVRLELDPARMQLIIGFFDVYVKLNDIENQMLMEELQMLDPSEGEMIMEIQTQWEIDGELRGIEKGIEKGKLVEAHTFIGKFIKAQFGEDCRDLLAIVDKVRDIDLLEKLADVLFRTSRLEEAQKLVNEAYQKQNALD
jgi:hypothetical protein